jgi:hypothetical protein
MDGEKVRSWSPFFFFFCLIFSSSFIFDFSFLLSVGHKAIAQLANDRLTTAAKVEDLLFFRFVFEKKNQAAVAHYLGAMHMYEVAPMPDDYAFSPDGHWSEPFHFYNMNQNDTKYYPRYWYFLRNSCLKLCGKLIFVIFVFLFVRFST